MAAEDKNKPTVRPKNMFADIFNQPHNPLLNTIDEFFNMGRSYIPVEYNETDTHFNIEARLPGISKKEINLDLIRDYLRIRVDRKEELISDDQFSRRREMYLERVISLPPNVSVSGMKATHRDGILKVSFPKIKGKKIDID